MINPDNDPNIVFPMPPILPVPIAHSRDLTAGDIAYEIFGLIPVTGTFIGVHHTYKACTSDDPIEGWEIAKIITQLFSFLIVPQMILGIAHSIKAIADCCCEDSFESMDLQLPPPVLVDDSLDMPLPPPMIPDLGDDGQPANLAIPLDGVDANGLPLPIHYV